MKAYGMGEKEPIHSNSTRSGRKKNRRIEFKLSLNKAAQSDLPLNIDSNAREQRFNFDNIVFRLNSSRMTSSSEQVVEAIGRQLLTLGDFKLEIVGHTDTSGRAAFNNKLSTERAEIVYEKLVKMGVDPAKMKAYGLGESEPLYSNATRAGRKKNRRIEFRLYQLNQ